MAIQGAQFGQGWSGRGDPETDFLRQQIEKERYKRLLGAPQEPQPMDPQQQMIQQFMQQLLTMQMQQQARSQSDEQQFTREKELRQIPAAQPPLSPEQTRLADLQAQESEVNIAKGKKELEMGDEVPAQELLLKAFEAINQSAPAPKTKDDIAKRQSVFSQYLPMLRSLGVTQEQLQMLLDAANAGVNTWRGENEPPDPKNRALEILTSLTQGQWPDPYQHIPPATIIPDPAWFKKPEASKPTSPTAPAPAPAAAPKYAPAQARRDKQRSTDDNFRRALMEHRNRGSLVYDHSRPPKEQIVGGTGGRYTDPKTGEVIQGAFMPTSVQQGPNAGEVVGARKYAGPNPETDALTSRYGMQWTNPNERLLGGGPGQGMARTVFNQTPNMGQTPAQGQNPYLPSPRSLPGAPSGFTPPVGTDAFAQSYGAPPSQGGGGESEITRLLRQKVMMNEIRRQLGIQ